VELELTVRPVRPGDIMGMTRVILAARGLRGAELEVQIERDLARFRSQGVVEMIEREALVAMHGARMVGVMRYGAFDGECHLSRPEIDPAYREETVAAALLQGFWPHMEDEVRKASVIDYPVADAAIGRVKTLGDVLLQSGFRELVERTDMALRLLKPIAPQRDELVFTSYDKQMHDRFFQAFQSSFTGSLDPTMEWDAEHPEESFMLFRDRFGHHDPNLWVLASDSSGRDVGFVLFQHFLGGRYAGDTVLLYTAVVPEARGRGYGEEIVREGLRRVRQRRGADARVSLTVSETNVPARRIYDRLGFRAVEDFSVYVMERPRD
jgi:ribosomal protein S18 acetylase RimI-like enzyme